jgi:L-serine dehydratase
MTQGVITTSVFDLFKIGPGPSSSHTIGPMKAGYDFLQRIQHQDFPAGAGVKIEIHLYGSLSATGKGHGTDRAVIAGVLGWLPETADPTAFTALLKEPEQEYQVQLAHRSIPVNASSVLFQRVKYNSPHPNTVIFKLLIDGFVIHEEEYYSVGGGFIIRKGEAPSSQEHIVPPYPYSTMKELKAHLSTHQISLTELMLANEEAISGLDRKTVYKKIDDILDTMHRSVKRGLKSKGELPGTIRLRRKAPVLFSRPLHPIALWCF